MGLNISNTSVTSDGSTFVVNNGSANVINFDSTGRNSTGARIQSADIGLGNGWYELPSTYRGSGGGLYRRAAKWFNGNDDNNAQVNNIFRATPNYGWGQNVVYYRIYGGGYQGTQTGEYFFNSDGSAQGTWTPTQYIAIGAMGGVGAVAPTISSITRSGDVVDSSYYTYTVQHTMPRWSSTLIEIEWLADYYTPTTSISGKFQIALL